MVVQEYNCRNCGAPLIKEHKHCDYCGTEFKYETIQSLVSPNGDWYGWSIHFYNPLAHGYIEYSNL